MSGFTGPYPPEFRERAVRLAREPGSTVKGVARDLGVSYESLRKWLKQSQIDAGEREGLTTEQLQELRELRRENKILRGEREILRAAAAFFAREEQTGTR